METLISKIALADWQSITEAIHQNGYAIIPMLLTDEQCTVLRTNYTHPTAYRKTVVMERYRFG